MPGHRAALCPLRVPEPDTAGYPDIRNLPGRTCILWEAANGEWLKQQEEKRKEKEKNGAHVTKRKKKQTVRNKIESIMNRIVLNINIL